MYDHPDSPHILTEDQLREQYDDMLDEVFPSYEFAGATFLPSSLLRGADPIAYRVGFHGWLDAEGWEEAF